MKLFTKKKLPDSGGSQIRLVARISSKVTPSLLNNPPWVIKTLWLTTQHKGNDWKTSVKSRKVGSSIVY